jgi:hypothetical protein
MKFFRNTYNTQVSIRPEMIVPRMESSGFFIVCPHNSMPKEDKRL